MEASAQRLDGTLFKKVNDYGNCPICNVPFGNNIANHICGMKHCKNVRYAVNFTMPRSSAEQMTSTLCPHTRISGLPRLLRMVYWRRGRPHRRRGRCGQRRRPPRQRVPPRWRRRRSQTAGAGPVWRPSHPDVGKIMCWAVPVKSGAGGNDDICAVALGGHVETRPQAVGVALQSLLGPAVG